MRFSPSRRTVASLAASLDRRPGNTVHASTNSRLRVCSPLLPSVDLSPRLLSRKRASFALGTETNDVETELRESPQHVRHTEVEEEKEKEDIYPSVVASGDFDDRYEGCRAWWTTLTVVVVTVYR